MTRNQIMAADEGKLYHIQTALAEAAALQLLGIDRAPHAKPPYGIPETVPPIECRYGVPVVPRNDVRPEALCMVWSPCDGNNPLPRHLKIERMAFGHQILEAKLIPSKKMCSHPEQNWEIPQMVDSIEIKPPVGPSRTIG
jgi:hypothetical protein